MDDDQLRIALDTLRVEEAQGAARIHQLKLELWAVEQRQESVRTAIAGLSAIVDEAPATPPPATLATKDEPRTAISLTQDPSENAEHDEVEIRRIKRIPSAKWLSEIVDDLNQVLTRDELFKAYEKRHGFAPTWKQPRNVLGTALNRAVERGQIQSLGGNRYAPIRFDADNSASTQSSEENSDG